MGNLLKHGVQPGPTAEERAPAVRMCGARWETTRVERLSRGCMAPNSGSFRLGGLLWRWYEMY